MSDADHEGKEQVYIVYLACDFGSEPTMFVNAPSEEAAIAITTNAIADAGDPDGVLDVGFFADVTSATVRGDGTADCRLCVGPDGIFVPRDHETEQWVAGEGDDVGRGCFPANVTLGVICLDTADGPSTTWLRLREPGVGPAFAELAVEEPAEAASGEPAEAASDEPAESASDEPAESAVGEATSAHDA